MNAIQEVKESVALLTQLLQDYDSTATSQSNAELVQVRRRAPRGGGGGDPSLNAPLCGQDLYQRCEKMRPTLFRLASDTEDNDEALGEGPERPLVLSEDAHNHPREINAARCLCPVLSTAEILQANDSLTHVINLYKQQVKGEIVNGNGNRPKQSGGPTTDHARSGVWAAL